VLKDAIRAGRPDDTPIEIGPGDRRPLGALRDQLLTVQPGQKVAYVVDTLFSPANAAAITRLAAGADLFFCEAPFLEADVEQATKRHHLTARQAGRPRARRRRERLKCSTSRPRYEGRYREIEHEA
jgi:ribonuclease Z